MRRTLFDDPTLRSRSFRQSIGGSLAGARRFGQLFLRHLRGLRER